VAWHASLADIAEAAGVTRGAIYWHFKNKSDVFAAMCDRVNLPVEALCSPERIASQEDPLGSIRDICAFVFRQTVNNPQWRRVFEIIFHKCEMVEDNGAIFVRQRQSHQEGTVKMREHLRLAMERGQLPADLDLPLAVNAFHAAIGGVLAHWLFSPRISNWPARPNAWRTHSSTHCASRRLCAWATCHAPWRRSMRKWRRCANGSPSRPWRRTDSRTDC
jgi:AcrR family transcriptional regulator